MWATHIQAGFSAPVLDGSDVVGLGSLLLGVPPTQVHLLPPCAASPALCIIRFPPVRMEQYNIIYAEIKSLCQASAKALLRVQEALKFSRLGLCKCSSGQVSAHCLGARPGGVPEVRFKAASRGVPCDAPACERISLGANAAFSIRTVSCEERRHAQRTVKGKRAQT